MRKNLVPPRFVMVPSRKNKKASHHRPRSLVSNLDEVLLKIKSKSIETVFPYRDGEVAPRTPRSVDDVENTLTIRATVGDEFPHEDEAWVLIRTSRACVQRKRFRGGSHWKKGRTGGEKSTETRRGRKEEKERESWKRKSALKGVRCG